MQLTSRQAVSCDEGGSMTRHACQQLAFISLSETHSKVEHCMLMPSACAGPKDYEYGKVYQLEWKCA